LKDSAALDRYLVEAGTAGRVLETPGGARGGQELAELVEHALRLRSLMGFVPRRYDPAVIEALALAGALQPDIDAAARQAATARTAEWLGRADKEAVWTGQLLDDGSVQITRVWRGVADVYPVDANFLVSAEARKLARVAGEKADVYSGSARLVRAGAADAELESDAETTAGGDDEPAAPVRQTAADAAITRPSQLLDTVLANGRKGLSIARYKGLGEMNAEQLWETTLDPDNRILLQVKVEDADVTDEIFTRLMGDVVEPRRDFIQENALNVANLDV
ncbi:MAG: DNA gyrase subunit B, partial [Novosphingobium sp.]